MEIESLAIVVARVCDAGLQKAEAGGLQVLGQPGLYCKTSSNNKNDLKNCQS